MTKLAKLAIGLFGLLALARAVFFLEYCRQRIGIPLAVWLLELKMAHLAWRAQAGVRLYPEWREFPYVSNFFGPCYFVLVGLIGRWLGADLDPLCVIGRSVTLSCSLGGSVVVGVWAARRCGVGAGLLASVVSFGPAVMIGFGLMVRPDAMSGLLGFAGFLLAVGERRGWRVLGALLLVAAFFTKQTSVLFLLAATIYWLVEGRRSRAASLIFGCGALIVVIVGCAVFTWEPNFAASLIGERTTPWSAANWLNVMFKLMWQAPDLVVLSAIGVWLWGQEASRDRSSIVLTTVLWLGGVMASVKDGSDLNYFLDLRFVEAMAASALAARVFGSSRIGSTIARSQSLVPTVLWGMFHLRRTPRDAGQDDESERRREHAQAKEGNEEEEHRNDIGDHKKKSTAQSVGSSVDRQKMAIAAVLAAISLVPGLLICQQEASSVRFLAEFAASPRGTGYFASLRKLEKMVEDPKSRILTNVSHLQYHMRQRACIPDPWLFRIQVDCGEIEPKVMESRLERGCYDLIITSELLFAGPGPREGTPLPRKLIERASGRYEYEGRRLGLFVYRRIGEPDADCGKDGGY